MENSINVDNVHLLQQALLKEAAHFGMSRWLSWSDSCGTTLCMFGMAAALSKPGALKSALRAKRIQEARVAAANATGLPHTGTTGELDDYIEAAGAVFLGLDPDRPTGFDVAFVSYWPELLQERYEELADYYGGSVHRSPADKVEMAAIGCVVLDLMVQADSPDREDLVTALGDRDITPLIQDYVSQAVQYHPELSNASPLEAG